jgi:hypothetical protein
MFQNDEDFENTMSDPVCHFRLVHNRAVVVCRPMFLERLRFCAAVASLSNGSCLLPSINENAIRLAHNSMQFYNGRTLCCDHIVAEVVRDSETPPCVSHDANLPRKKCNEQRGRTNAAAFHDGILAVYDDQKL